MIASALYRAVALQRHLFRGIAGQLASAMESAQLYQMQQQETEVSAALATVGRELIATLDTPPHPRLPPAPPCPQAFLSQTRPPADHRAGSRSRDTPTQPRTVDAPSPLGSSLAMPPHFDQSKFPLGQLYATRGALNALTPADMKMGIFWHSQGLCWRRERSGLGRERLLGGATPAHPLSILRRERHALLGHHRGRPQHHDHPAP